MKHTIQLYVIDHWVDLLDPIEELECAIQLGRMEFLNPHCKLRMVEFDWRVIS